MGSTILERILAEGEVLSPDGRRLPLAGHVKPVFHRALADVVRRVAPTTVVEVGMAYGISSLVIGGVLAELGGERLHVVIDGFQNSHYEGIGLANMARAGLDASLRFVEEPSHLGLPRLLREGLQADFVFIDGNHTRDYVAVDAFYAHRLLRVGGVVAFDDCRARGVRTAVTNLLRHYGYRELATRPDFWWGRRVRTRIASWIGMGRPSRIRYLEKLDDSEPT